MSVTIPLPVQVPPLPRFDVGPELDGVSYTLHLGWDDRLDAWFLRMLDEPGQRILLGDVRVGANFPFYRVWNGRQPPGYLMAWDTSGSGVDPTLADLFTRFSIRYYSETEIRALGIVL